MVPGMISPGPLGPGAVQNFGLCHFTAAPGSDQPWQRVRDRGCAGRGRSKNRREGQAPPLRDGTGNVPRRGTGGSPDTPAGAPPQRFRSRAIRRARLVQCGGESAGESYSPPDQTASARRAKGGFWFFGFAMRHPFHTKIQFNYKTKLPPLQRWECEKRLNKCWDVLASLSEGARGMFPTPYPSAWTPTARCPSPPAASISWCRPTRKTAG